MLVCSYDDKRELRDLEVGRRVCPVCGAPIVEGPADPGPVDTPVVEPMTEEPVRTNPDGGKTEDDADEQDRAKAPPVVLVCEVDPRHDIRDRRPDDWRCPQPGCQGAIADLICVHDPRHDLTELDRVRMLCPVCDGPVMKLVCSTNHLHSLAGRAPGQRTCPIDGALLERDALRKPPPNDSEETGGWIIWLREHWPWVAGGIAVFCLIGVFVFGKFVIQTNACGGGIEEVNRILGTKPAVAKLRDEAEARIACHRADLAMPLFRSAADNNDGASARRLAQIYDPTVALPDLQDRPKPVPVYAWHWYEVASSNDAASADDMKRLRSWAEGKPDDPGAAELNERLRQ